MEDLEELQAFWGLMPLLSSDWWLPWSSGVHAFDASLYGYGVSYSEVDVQTVAEIGRVPEKSRFRLGSSNAREHAARTAGFGYDQARRRVVELGFDCPSESEVGRRTWEYIPLRARYIWTTYCDVQFSRWN